MNMLAASTSNRQTSPAAKAGDGVRVFVADDHPAIREALEHTLISAIGMTLCGEASSAQESFRLIGELKPDVAIVDISLSDAHGLEVVEKIRTNYHDVQVVVFSVYDEKIYAERAIRAGACAYLMKSEPLERLLEAVRRASRGETYLSIELTSHMLRKSGIKRTSSLGFAIDDLTERERAVFQLLGKGHSMVEIAEHLGIDPKTVETYRRRVKEKLGFETVSELLQYAFHWTET